MTKNDEKLWARGEQMKKSLAKDANSEGEL